MKIEKEEKSKKKEAIPAAIKTLVWNKYIGEKVAEAKCMCCRVTTISMRHFHAGHVLSEKYGGGVTVDNLRPICANCNLSMGSANMADFISKFGLHK
jgi:5-methylcytosine-specific restriction endonuclease McrA